MSRSGSGAGVVTGLSYTQTVIVNTTIRGNSSGRGGGVWANGPTRINNSTIVENHPDGVYYNQSSAARTISNSVVADNAYQDLHGCQLEGDYCNMYSTGHNLLGRPWESSDATDQIGDPGLSAFSNWGGPTPGYLPLPSSPLAGAGEYRTGRQHRHGVRDHRSAWTDASLLGLHDRGSRVSQLSRHGRRLRIGRPGRLVGSRTVKQDLEPFPRSRALTRFMG